VTDTEIPIASIVVDPALQPRVEGLDPEHVSELEAVVADSSPPVVVVPGEERETYILVDGAHRLASALDLRMDTIRARIVSLPDDGDLAGLAFSLNATHGKPLTLADRRARARVILTQSPTISNLEVARQVGLSPTTITTIRARLEEEESIEPTEQRVARDGTTYTVSERITRPPGEIPKAGLGEVVGGVFTSRERRQQRHIASYFSRLAVALDEQHELDGFTTFEDAAQAIELVLGEDRALDLAQRLGLAAYNTLEVARELGYEPPEQDE
jgi:ParB-like chromosome segregation protein Spo0J